MMLQYSINIAQKSCIMVIMSNIILLIYALTSSLGLVLLKLGGQTGAPISVVDGKPVFNLGVYAIGGIALYGISFVIYTYLCTTI